MNYKLALSEKGSYWIKQTWNEETQQVESEALAINEPLILDPRDFMGDSSVFLFKDTPVEIMRHEDGSAYTIEDLIAEIQKNEKNVEFEPVAWYNAPGDLLEINWKPDYCFVEWLGNGIEVCRHPETKEVVGAKVWGVKKLLLKAYANCDKPKKAIEIKAFDPRTNSNPENMD